MKWFLILFFVILASCSGDKGGGDGYILGTGRLSQESGRIPAGTISPWRAIDRNDYDDTTLGVRNGHSHWVTATARLNAFGDIPYIRADDSIPDSVEILNQFETSTDAARNAGLETLINKYPNKEAAGYVVNISQGPLFRPMSLPLSPSLLQSKDVLLVVSSGNGGSLNPTHGQTQTEDLAALELLLMVTGLGEGSYRRHSRADACGWAKVFCVAAPYVVHLPIFGRLAGTSFSAPLVSSLLANARLLWPAMTSRQTFRLAQFCARPANADGSLGAWGTILTEAQADDDLGQGVFSVECLYASNGALTNPITGVVLRGFSALRGTSSQIRLTDPFGRSYTQSNNGGGVVLPLLPIEQELPQQLAGYFFEKDKVMGVRLPYLNVGLRVDENSFFSSKGYEDFELGDSVAMFVQLSYQFSFDNLDLNFYGLFVFSDMIPSGGSIIRDAQGFSQQLTAQAEYDLEGWQLGATITHNFGVTGKLKLAGYGEVKLSPESATQVRLSLRSNF